MSGRVLRPERAHREGVFPVRGDLRVGQVRRLRTLDARDRPRACEARRGSVGHRSAARGSEARRDARWDSRARLSCAPAAPNT